MRSLYIASHKSTALAICLRTSTDGKKAPPPAVPLVPPPKIRRSEGGGKRKSDADAKGKGSTKKSYKPTEVEKAWEAADAAADKHFEEAAAARQQLEGLFEVASNSRVYARSELKACENERWWWRDFLPSAASPVKKKRKSEEDEFILECDESYSGLARETDVDKQLRREQIVRVSQETLILRYAATILRQKARDMAAKRLKKSPATASPSRK